MNNKLNNKGFTLIEVITAMFVSSIVFVAIMGLLVSGSKTNNNVNATVRLENEAQIVSSIIREYLIDTTKSVEVTGNNLTVVSERTSGAPLAIPSDGAIVSSTRAEVTEIRMNTTNDELVLANYEEGSPATSPVTLSNLVTSFTPTIINDTISPTTATSVRVDMEFMYQGKTLATSQTISLRNRPEDVTAGP